MAFLASFYSSEQIFSSVSVFVSKNQINWQSLLFYVDLPHTNFIRIGHVGGWVNRFTVLWDSSNQYVVAVFSKVEHSPHVIWYAFNLHPSLCTADNHERFGSCCLCTQIIFYYQLHLLAMTAHFPHLACWVFFFH